MKPKVLIIGFGSAGERHAYILKKKFKIRNLSVITNRKIGLITLKKTQDTAQTQKGLAKGRNIKGNQKDYNSFIDFAYNDDQIEEQISKDHTEKVVTETKPEMTGADRVSYTKRYLLRAAMIGSRLASGEIRTIDEAIDGLNKDPTSKISQEELDKEVKDILKKILNQSQII